MTLDTDQLWCSNFNPADEKILTKGEKKQILRRIV